MQFAYYFLLLSFFVLDAVAAAVDEAVEHMRWNMFAKPTHFCIHFFFIFQLHVRTFICAKECLFLWLLCVSGDF